ncbi:MAG: sigma-70 family RNA polymerase sigma factor [Huintestinicola sp.]
MHIPLTNEQFFDLIKDGNEDLKPVLWERVKNLAYMLASQFYRRNVDLCRSRGLEEWDIKQLSYLAYALLFESYNTDKKYGYTTALGYAFSNQLRKALGNGADVMNRITSSLDELIGDQEDGKTVADLIADEDSSAPFEEIEDNSERESIGNYLREEVNKLPDQEREVIQKHYFDNKNYDSISEERGISRERVRQIHASALRHLRKPKILRRLEDDLGYSSYRLYDRHSSVEYIATERAYLDELYNQYVAQREERERLAAVVSCE